MDYQRQDSAQELLAGWMGELEGVLYSSEVEEAIKEVLSTRTCCISMHFSVSAHSLMARCVPVTTPWTRKTSIQ